MMVKPRAQTVTSRNSSGAGAGGSSPASVGVVGSAVTIRTRPAIDVFPLIRCLENDADAVPVGQKSDDAPSHLARDCRNRASAIRKS